MKVYFFTEEQGTQICEALENAKEYAITDEPNMYFCDNSNEIKKYNTALSLLVPIVVPDNTEEIARAIEAAIKKAIENGGRPKIGVSNLCYREFAGEPEGEIPIITIHPLG